MTVDRITNLPELTNIAGDDSIPIVDDTDITTKRVTADTLYSYFDTLFITPSYLPGVKTDTRDEVKDRLRDAIFIVNTSPDDNTASFFGNFSVSTSTATSYTISYDTDIICSMFLISSVGSNGSNTLDLSSASTTFNDGTTSKTASAGEYLWCVLSPNDGKFYVISTNIP